jgi:hypothetical protein
MNDSSAMSRDRDPVGRARNARPRDALGRPLRRDAAGVPTTPDDPLPPGPALVEAQRLFVAGRPFHAHEVLEGVWKGWPDLPEAERELWRGLAQLAVGLTHARRGNPVGAARLLLRGAERVEPYARSEPHGVPVNDLVAWARGLAARIELGGLAGVPEAALVPRVQS